jgi:hypothetical protein
MVVTGPLRSTFENFSSIAQLRIFLPEEYRRNISARRCCNTIELRNAPLRSRDRLLLDLRARFSA